MHSLHAALQKMEGLDNSLLVEFIPDMSICCSARIPAAVTLHRTASCSSADEPELTSHSEWMRQRELFTILVDLSFFKQHELRMVSCFLHKPAGL